MDLGDIRARSGVDQQHLFYQRGQRGGGVPGRDSKLSAIEHCNRGFMVRRVEGW